MMKVFLHVAILWTTMSVAWAQACEQCSTTTCRLPIKCKGNIAMDTCYCCPVCARVEGEVCGGPHYERGQCDTGLVCMSRDIRDHRNRMKNSTLGIIGRCEPVSCPRLRCAFGQRCFLVNGMPSCACSADCLTDMVTTPVCGASNARRYENECQLRRDECRIGRKIGLSEQPCLDPNISHVTCTDHVMTLTVARRYLGRVNEGDVLLLDGTCGATMNATHVVFTTELKKCGTRKWFALTSVVYSNVARSSVTTTTSDITRKRIISIPFECEYRLRQRNRNKVIFQTTYQVDGSDRETDATLNAVGDLTDAQRNVRSPPRCVPTIDHKRQYVVKISSKRFHGDGYKVLPSNCYAVPIPRDRRARRVTLISNGCPVDNGVRILPSNDSSVVLSVPRVAFVGCHPTGFAVRCRLRACVKSNDANVDNCNAPTCGRQRRSSVSSQRGNIELDAEIEAVALPLYGTSTQ